MASMLSVLPLLALSPQGIVSAFVLKQAEPEKSEFFENKVRPILAGICYECHSARAAKLKGGLYLDTREGVLKGGETGPAIVPGDPEASLLIKAVRYRDENLKMPPKRPLKAEEIAVLEAWVKMGAPDPRKASAAADKASRPKLWSLDPPRDPPISTVKRADWVQTTIDRFIVAKLEARGLEPSKPADKLTLLRRASYDLIGLPPTPEEIEGFLQDGSPDAYPRLVDRLLASPRYGERWGRYWLDVARYADTKGYLFEEERRFPYSFTYRDWVIQALNRDLPYDRFLVLQIAADLTPCDKSDLAAMGFLTVGRRFLNNIPDIIDDRLDVAIRGTMGLTIGCARCHDHKFDPIPTRDYYSLYGVFAGSREPKQGPLIGASVLPADAAAYETARASLEQAAENFRETRFRQVAASYRSVARTAEYLIAAARLGNVDETALTGAARKGGQNALMLRRWKDFMDRPIMAPWKALASIPEAEFAKKAREISSGPFAGASPDTLEQAAKTFAVYLSGLDELQIRIGCGRHALASEVSVPPDGRWKAFLGPDAPASVPLQDAEKLLDRADRDKLRKLRNQVDALDVTHPGSPPRAMVLEEGSAAANPRVFVRGNPSNLGEEVPRRFLSCLSGGAFSSNASRLELARSITSPENPLTARVWVNRIWMHHFGVPLVKTPSDFGTRGEPPTHPELLDYLARRFVEGGWSTKSLHREILLSASYRQASYDRPDARGPDPENSLLWRMNPSRLDFEAMRDSLLWASGRIDYRMGGRSADIIAAPFSRRRTVYAYIERQNLPNVFRAFDFASPDSHSPARHMTTVPQQALFLMNSPFVLEQARGLALRVERIGGQATNVGATPLQEDKPPAPAPRVPGDKPSADRPVEKGPSEVAREPAREGKPSAPDLSQERSEERIRELYRLVFGRAPDSREVELGLEFVRSCASPWVKYAQALLLSNEFIFVD